MSYTALYRKFRPQEFEDVKGQEHIVTTLKNQIKADRIGHAYLFCGTRGTGKTTAAKIFAKAVNCEHPVDGSPCGTCEACRAIAAGNSMNVIEIDAASNNGVENIRQIREEVEYAPTEGKYKVYIIDEVHMLTGEAFNALLKTLEEPPPHVLFILATTEPHKIPLTVLSRCQRFDFRRIGEADICAHLARIAGLEGIDIEPAALALIAKKSEGGMRDAVNLLDQCNAYGEQKIDLPVVQAVLGCVDSAFTAAAAEHMLAGNLPAVLAAAAELAAAGRDFRQFLYDLLDDLRERLLANLDGKQADAFPPNRILQAIQALSEADSRLRYSLQPRITMELALIKATGFTPSEGRPAATTAVTSISAPTKQAPKPKPAPAPLPQPQPAPIPATPTVAEPAPSSEMLPLQALDIGLVQDLWPRLLEAVGQGDENSTLGFLQWGRPAALEGNTLVLAFPKDFALHMKTLLTKPAHRKRVETKLQEIFDKPLKISGTLEERSSEAPGEPEQGSLF